MTGGLEGLDALLEWLPEFLGGSEAGSVRFCDALGRFRVWGISDGILGRSHMLPA